MSELNVRLHLVAPAAPAADVAGCLAAACAAGDIASLLAPPLLVAALIDLARRHDVAILTTDAEAARRLDCDGVEVDSAEAYEAARALLGHSRIVGGRCEASRHLAMALAEAGADYVALAQAHDRPGVEPIIAWWSSLFEIPCIAADPVEPPGVAALLSQRPDFIRPADRMWRSADESRAIVAQTMKAIAEQVS
jgi:thiamine-phosphate pyrophosphorylase